MADPRQQPLYNSAIIQSFIRYTNAVYPNLDRVRLFSMTGIEAHQVEDNGHWFSQEQVDRFHDSVVKLTGNPNVAREAGRFTSTPDAMGTMARYAVGFIGPAKVFEMIGQITRRYTRSATYESRRVGRNRIELIVTPREGIEEQKYQCDNRMGYFDAIVSHFNHNLPSIEHPECVFHGGSCCRYTVTWTDSKAEVWKRARTLVILAAGVCLPLSWLLVPPGWFPGIAGALVGSGFLLASVSSRFERAELKLVINNLRTTTEGLVDMISVNYDHALMINEIGRIIGKCTRIDTLLPEVCTVLQKRLDFDRGLVLLTSDDQSRLVYRAGFGYSPAQVDELAQEGLHLDQPQSRGIFVRCFREQRPFLVNDVSVLEGELSQRSQRFLQAVGSKSFLCCPIVFEDRCLGVLAVDNVETKRPLVESDINLLMGVAPEIGISLHNALQTHERDAQFESVIRTLAASIDARDALTAGHSQRVTDYSVAICRELGLDREFTEVIRVAAQLHDYGKIAIRDAVLKKEGPLEPEERAEIETHAAKSEEILSQIRFVGAYRQVPFIAGAHHERLDGAGYPRGLVGDEIPFGARIIAVADFFEAITARRHYRAPMTFDQAVALLKDEAGPHLEPRIVAALLRVLGLQDRGVDPQQAITGV